MKLIRAICMVCLISQSAFHNVSAACAVDDPAAVAKSFYASHAQFSSEDPAKLKGIVTTRLFDALDKEYKCAQGELCALEADPWTDAQDGAIGKPVEFATARNSGTQAAVSMSYTFILDKAHRHQQSAKLLLQRKSSSECWLIDDVVGPRGDSLVQTIEKWHKEFGGGH